MLPTELVHRVAVAMKGYSVERLDKIYHAAMKADNDADFPPWNLRARADLFVIACAYMNKDWGFAGELFYLVRLGIKEDFYKEEELVDEIREILKLRKIQI